MNFRGRQVYKGVFILYQPEKKDRKGMLASVTVELPPNPGALEKVSPTLRPIVVRLMKQELRPTDPKRPRRFEPAAYFTGRPGWGRVVNPDSFLYSPYHQKGVHHGEAAVCRRAECIRPLHAGKGEVKDDEEMGQPGDRIRTDKT
jgi:hypothetical protein